MKKTLIALATLVAAYTNQAATLNWGVDMNSLLYVTEDGSSVTMANSYSGDTTGWQFCLVYLGTSQTIDISSVSSSTVVDSFDYAVYPDGDDAYLDEFSSSFVTTGKATALDDNHTEINISAGDYFGIVFFNGESYSQISTVEGGEIKGSFSETKALSNLSATANPVNLFVETEGIAVSSVPEPSVAILGLLGLGMLIKRRRA